MRVGIVSLAILVSAAFPGAAQAPALGNLAFMAGCWNGDAGRGRVIAESWTAVFENLAHDFPQRIIYRRAADTLIARIEADTPRARGTEWRMGRTACW